MSEKRGGRPRGSHTFSIKGGLEEFRVWADTHNVTHRLVVESTQSPSSNARPSVIEGTCSGRTAQMLLTAPVEVFVAPRKK